MDKLVSYDDHNTIEDARRWIADMYVGPEEISGKARVLDLLDRLRVEAEADRPPLPEGWVIYDLGEGHRRYLHYRLGGLFISDHPASARFGDVTPQVRKDLTPLRPTVTEADVEKAAEAVRDQFHADYDQGPADIPGWPDAGSRVRESWRVTARAAFTAAGIEVRDDS